jgi:hypothetical protein
MFHFLEHNWLPILFYLLLIAAIPVRLCVKNKDAADWMILISWLLFLIYSLLSIVGLYYLTGDFPQDKLLIVFLEIKTFEIPRLIWQVLLTIPFLLIKKIRLSQYAVRSLLIIILIAGIDFYLNYLLLIKNFEWQAIHYEVWQAEHCGNEPR